MTETKQLGAMDEKLLERVAAAKAAGKTVGLVQGSWDLFHLGHLRYILKARALCDFLIIAMDSDAKIRKRKGPTRPVIPEEERYEFIKLLGIADGVVVKRVDEPKWHLISGDSGKLYCGTGKAAGKILRTGSDSAAAGQDFDFGQDSEDHNCESGAKSGGAGKEGGGSGGGAAGASEVGARRAGRNAAIAG